MAVDFGIHCKWPPFTKIHIHIISHAYFCLVYFNIIVGFFFSCKDVEMSKTEKY